MLEAANRSSRQLVAMNPGSLGGYAAYRNQQQGTARAPYKQEVACCALHPAAARPEDPDLDRWGEQIDQRLHALLTHRGVGDS